MSKVYGARPVMGSILRGLRRRCPACGEGHAFAGYTRLADACPACGEPLGHIRADDFPPYLTIMVVGHIVVPMVLWAEQANWSMGLQMAVWPLVSLLLVLACLPYLKGGVVGLMWSLRLGGNEFQGQAALPTRPTE